MITEDHVDGCHLRHLGQPPREKFNVLRRDSGHLRVEDVSTDEDVVHVLCLTIIYERLENLPILVVTRKSADVHIRSVRDDQIDLKSFLNNILYSQPIFKNTFHYYTLPCSA